MPAPSPRTQPNQGRVSATIAYCHKWCGISDAERYLRRFPLSLLVIRRNVRLHLRYSPLVESRRFFLHIPDMKEGQKVVIWTIFTETIRTLASALADLNPVTLYGAVPSGSELDLDTREGRVRRFHVDERCGALIANPAAAGEGISLHTVCHNAIYADRSYVSTHYLQSIDRIHRLGLGPNDKTNIYVYRSKAPPEIGSIDLSVSRRLINKIRNMQVLLDDPDLHEIAYDEEEADDPIDYEIRLEDIIDLIAELEGRMQPTSADEEE